MSSVELQFNFSSACHAKSKVYIQASGKEQFKGKYAHIFLKLKFKLL